MDRNRLRLERATRAAAVGKVSGAVGTYAHIPPAIEQHVCDELGIGIEPASSQITHRDRHAEFVSTLALVGASLERFATEIRHLQRSEVGEVRESFGAGQKGSSAMPHKRNPIATENVTGLARLLRGYAAAGLENVALWHERDISHSSVERVILPDACLVLDFALVRMTAVIANLVVDAGRMAENLSATRGLVFSQAVLLALIEDQGISRDGAYRIVQRCAMATWEGDGDLRSELEGDPEVTLTSDRFDQCFDPQSHLTNAALYSTGLRKCRSESALRCSACGLLANRAGRRGSRVDLRSPQPRSSPIAYTSSTPRPRQGQWKTADGASEAGVAPTLNVKVGTSQPSAQVFE